MSNTENLALSWIIKAEGGYSNNKADAGGETKFGISQRAYPYLNIASLTIEQAEAIYMRDYFNRYRCDEIPPALALVAFDSFVNHRPTTAARILQMSVGTTVDGLIGPKTIAAAEGCNIKQAIDNMLTERAEYYANIVKAKSWQAVFLKGWFARLFHLQEFLIENKEALNYDPKI